MTLSARSGPPTWSEHEPEELGDSARTLGFLCYENLSARIERRIVGHPLEATRWGIDGLQLRGPKVPFGWSWRHTTTTS